MMPTDDLAAVVEALRHEGPRLAGAELLVTGGTGFFGHWLVMSLLALNRALALGLRVHVLARRPERLALRDPSLVLHAGDIRSFELPSSARPRYVFHAATAASAALNATDPLEMASVAAEGTRHLLEVAEAHGAARVLFTSSGAVYGKHDEPAVEDQPARVDPLDVKNAYAEAKRMAELYCAIFAARGTFDVVVARCFAFVGPYLPLHAHFAIGNFLGDALAHRPIQVRGDGSALRTYLYASDLAIWLIRLLLDGSSGRAYNVGSETAVSVADLARLIAVETSNTVTILGQGPSERRDVYLPCTRRIREELGVVETVSLRDAVRRTLDWHLWSST
jgi:nucleoside-diphosphate-sugar epimerase